MSFKFQQWSRLRWRDAKDCLPKRTTNTSKRDSNSIQQIHKGSIQSMLVISSLREFHSWLHRFSQHSIFSVFLKNYWAWNSQREPPEQEKKGKKEREEHQRTMDDLRRDEGIWFKFLYENRTKHDLYRETEKMREVALRCKISIQIQLQNLNNFYGWIFLEKEEPSQDCVQLGLKKKDDVKCILVYCCPVAFENEMPLYHCLMSMSWEISVSVCLWERKRKEKNKRRRNKK